MEENEKIQNVLLVPLIIFEAPYSNRERMDPRAGAQRTQGSTAFLPEGTGFTFSERTSVLDWNKLLQVHDSVFQKPNTFDLLEYADESEQSTSLP